ncbi:adaptin n terminal region domain-containing protein, partial [Cystoisospora suis]
PCSVHLCSLLLDAAAPLIVPSLQNDSLEAVRRIHRSYRQQAGLHSPVTAADSELASSASEGTQHTTNADGVAGGSPGTSSYVAPVIIRAAAWIVGEYFQCISNFSDPSAPGDGSSDLTFYVDACRSLMKLACGLHLPAPVQQVVISAAVKVYLGTSASVVPATSNKQRSEPNVQLLRKVQQEMRVMLRRCRSNEAENTSGTNSVEVYDRVRLADQLLQFFGPSADPSMERIRIWSLQQENLLPVLPDAQQQVAMDPSLDLSIPFFDYRQLQSAPPSSSADPTGLASASGNTDTSPLNAGSPHKPWAAASLQDATAGSPPSKAPLPWGGSGRTPASAKKKFEVIKGAIAPTTTTAQKEAQAGPGRTLRESMGSGVSTSLSDAALQKGTDAAGCSPSAVGNTASSYQGFQRTLEPAMTAAAASLPLPQAMQAQLQQRLWQRSAEDDMLRVFTCTGPVTLPTAPDEPPALVLYACCEKKIEQSVEVQGVGLAFDEAADLRLPPVVPLASDLKKRSNKVTLKLCSFHSPLCCTSSMHLGNWQLQGQVLYSTMASKPTSSELQADESGPADTRAERGVLQQARAFAFRLEVPVTAALLPLRVNEDQLAHFLAQHASVISAQHSERVSVQALKPVPQPATSSPAWSLSIAGHSPTSPVAVLQYLRVVAASANMSLLPQQPIPVGDSSDAR